ncbi:methyltransferase [Aliihoeflea sp. 40Bstr573]|uniref:class I SAM-dependent methyltransferase n=1 Tax=Aliihoeflea sp. 40Bstr573 TaxID=2696467 RepID=UPI0020944DAF|nr:methyltransferase [Aliihoeflea sp. 40Bstr573]MCO6386956.1 methyltransferase [Aliihoeflea sp. 40Bstr573]
MGGSVPNGRFQENAVKDRRAFIRANTGLIAPPHVPEIELHLADEAHDLWHRTEAELEAIGLEPPFWAFAWAGGQGLARYVLDHPETVAGRRVVDFATGSGLVAIAAMKAGALHVLASDIDPFCAAAVALNAAANNIVVETSDRDLVGEKLDCDVLLAGDVFYDRSFADRLVPWLRELTMAGVTVLVGDPGRAYLPRERLAALARYEVPVTRILEDAEVKRTTVWQFG